MERERKTGGKRNQKQDGYRERERKKQEKKIIIVIEKEGKDEKR